MYGFISASLKRGTILCSLHKAFIEGAQTFNAIYCGTAVLTTWVSNRIKMYSSKPEKPNIKKLIGIL